MLIIIGCRESLDAIAQVLEKYHFAVHATPTPEAACLLARQTLPHLVLVDFAFPDSERDLLVKQLRSEPVTADLKLVALMAPEVRDRAVAARAGFDDCLSFLPGNAGFTSAVVRLIARSTRKWQAVARHNRQLCCSATNS